MLLSIIELQNCQTPGLVIDRDTNAAINIREEGKKILNTYKYTTV
ncbi:MAG: hypothetical protein RR290_03090 [Clostridia bacterium]